MHRLPPPPPTPPPALIDYEGYGTWIFIVRNKSPWLTVNITYIWSDDAVYAFSLFWFSWPHVSDVVTVCDKHSGILTLNAQQKVSWNGAWNIISINCRAYIYVLGLPKHLIFYCSVIGQKPNQCIHFQSGIHTYNLGLDDLAAAVLLKSLVKRRYTNLGVNWKSI